MNILPGARAARSAAILREESIVRQFAITVPSAVAICSEVTPAVASFLTESPGPRRDRNCCVHFWTAWAADGQPEPLAGVASVSLSRTTASAGLEREMHRCYEWVVTVITERGCRKGQHDNGDTRCAVCFATVAQGSWFYSYRVADARLGYWCKRSHLHAGERSSSAEPSGHR